MNRFRGDAGGGPSDLDDGPVDGDAGALRCGQRVEYKSTTHGGWIKCKISAMAASTGAVMVDVKPGVWIARSKQAASIRVPPGGDHGMLPQPDQRGSVDWIADGEEAERDAVQPLATPRFSLGQQLQYHSPTHVGWIPCTVVEVDEATGSIMLDVKRSWIAPACQEARLRIPRESCAQSKPISATGHIEL